MDIFSSSGAYAAHPGPYNSNIQDALALLEKDSFITRILQKDHTLWKPDPTEISNRLGWLDSPSRMVDAVSEITSFVGDVQKEGFTTAVLIGMGGSSLAPEVYRKIFGVAEGFLELIILDTTDPGAILRAQERIEPKKTLFIVSSKSGGTIETFSLMKCFYNFGIKKLGAGKVGAHWVVITDPGSDLQKLGEKLRFRKVFLNDPNIGGRFSALSYFGLVPAALLGIDIRRLLREAQTELQTFAEQDISACMHLGATIGSLALAGRDKVALLASDSLSPLGAWIEQLVAESTGKEGRGILPVHGSLADDAAWYAADRFFVVSRLQTEPSPVSLIASLRSAGHPYCEVVWNSVYSLAAEFLRWELATAVACRILGVNPFDQPNVESAKVQARSMIAAYKEKGVLPVLSNPVSTGTLSLHELPSANSVKDGIAKFLSPEKISPKPYVALQAYCAPSEKSDALLEKIRISITSRTGMAVTVGYGPRFLHSTGQLHKGDSGNGLFIQFFDTVAVDVPVPDEPGEFASSISFGVIRNAQMLGDRSALLAAKRTVLTVHCSSGMAPGLEEFLQLL